MFTHHYLENLLELDIKKQTLILRNNLVVWETSQNKTVEITGEQLDKFLRDAPTSSVN